MRSTILRLRPGISPRRASDVLVREEPLELRVAGRGIAVTMRTPGHDCELAAGFLVSEGVLRRRTDLLEIAPCQQGGAPENTMNVFLSPKVRIDFQQLTRHVFATSSCGLCGKASIDSVHQHFPPLNSSTRLAAGLLPKMSARLRAAQRAFDQTGGLHAAAIFELKGRLVVLREDVGRHNAVDKVIGHGFLNGLLPFDSHVLLVSGRASFEILQKALAARIPVVAAISAPSSLAVEFARESGQTLVGFLRGPSMNVYSCPERLRLPDSQ
jgi:FdhD protein